MLTRLANRLSTTPRASPRIWLSVREWECIIAGRQWVWLIVQSLREKIVILPGYRLVSCVSGSLPLSYEAKQIFVFLIESN